MIEDPEVEAERRRRRRRRRPWIVGAVTLLLAGLGAAFWFLFIPNWRPSLRDGERYGVDVSSHQGDIDWRAVAGDHIRFAYIKAKEGGDFTDARFRENWREVGEAGLGRGAYHFFTLCRPGREQARHFLAVAPPDRARSHRPSTSRSQATAVVGRPRLRSMRRCEPSSPSSRRRGVAK